MDGGENYPYINRAVAGFAAPKKGNYSMTDSSRKIGLTAHTPGPWEYDGFGEITEVARPYMRVCFLPSDHEKYASSKPNGYLIAAAPELLATLEIIVDLTKPGQTVSLSQATDIICDVWNAARAALAKAEEIPS